MLADDGYRVLTADSFERALEVLKTKSPDLLILDVRLGDFNGLQLIVTAPHPIPAIVVTGFADTVLERDARQLGAEYVVKPITRELLLSMIERQLPSPAASRERRGHLGLQNISCMRLNPDGFQRTLLVRDDFSWRLRAKFSPQGLLSGERNRIRLCRG